MDPEGKAIFSVQWAGEEESKNWFLEKKHNKWILIDKLDNDANTKISFSEKDAWIIFTNTDRDKEKYKSKINIVGDIKLGYKLIDLVTVLS